ncbi:MAG: SPOR domain-containing protein [Pseudomonadota bacterium]
MKKTLYSMMVAVLVLGSNPPAFAENTGAVKSFTFFDPCVRGLLPRVSLINRDRPKFRQELREVYPHLSESEASVVAFRVCNDVSIYGNNAALTQRLHENVEIFARQDGITPQSQTTKVSGTASVAATSPSSGAVMQMGLFSVEANANKTLAALQNAGLSAQKTRSGSLWRVVALNMSSVEAVSTAKNVAASLGIRDAYLIR